MAKVIDARRNGGEVVILGKHLTLPADDTPARSGVEPMIASVRYDPATDAIEAYLLVDGEYQWCPVGISRGAHKVMYADGSTMTGPLIMTGAQILADKGITAAPGISFAAQPSDGFYLNPQQEFSAASQGKHVLRIMPDGLYVVEDIHANRVFAVEVNGHQGNFDNLLVRVHAEINDQVGNTAFIKHITANLIDTVPADSTDKTLVAQAEFITQGANWQITHENDHRLTYTYQGATLVTFSDGGTVTAETFHGAQAVFTGTMQADHVEANSAHIAQGLSADNITANTVTVNVRTQSDTYIGNHVSISQETVTGSLVVNTQTRTDFLVANNAQVTGQTQTGSLVAGSARVSADTSTGTLAVAGATTTDSLTARIAQVTDTLQATHVAAGDARVTGLTQTGTLNVTGAAQTGSLATGSAQVTGATQTGSLSVSGATQSATLTAGQATITGAAQTGHLTVAGGAQIDTLTVTGATALNTVSAHTVSADAVTVGGAVQAGSFTGVSATLSGVVQAQGVIGQSGAFFGGDIAACFTADAVYDVGTVLKIGGNAEVTIANALADAGVVGVVSSAQGIRINAAGEAIANAVYLTTQGRTTVKAVGPIWKGDPLVSAGQGRAGIAQSANGITVPASAIIGRALQDLPGANVAVISIKV